MDTFADPATCAPRLDIAVGPFNSTFESRDEDSDVMRKIDSALVRRMNDAVSQQNELPFHNPNPRCLIGIEIEHSTSSKHILGGITNASMLGRFGIVVGPESHIAKIQRIHAYVRKLRDVGKANHDMFGNIACFEQDEFIGIIKQCGHDRGDDSIHS